MKKQLLTLVLLLSLVLLAACETGQTPTTPEATEQEISQSPLATPAAEETTASTPEPDPEAFEVPSPSPDNGVVTGVLLRGDPPEPPRVAILYLGRIFEEDGTPVMAGVNKQTAPRAQVDSEGRFAFAEVPPGGYALILDAITTTLILRNPQDGTDLIIPVTAGKITDLGRLVYPDMPPLP